MHDYLLSFGDAVRRFETDEKWIDAARYVFSNWENIPDDIHALLSAGTQLWYTILICEQHNLSVSHDSVKETAIEWVQARLMEITNYGFQNFSENACFNAYFGYMIHTMPYFFTDYHGDYCGWQKLGMDMVEKAYVLEPENPFVAAIYYEKIDIYMGSAYIEACDNLWRLTSYEEWGNSCVQQYFGRILNGVDYLRK